MSSILFRPKKSILQENTISEERLPSPSIFEHAQEEIAQEPVQQETQFPFEGENDLEREVERHTAMGTANILQGILGLPGNIQELIESVTGAQSPRFVKLPSTSDLESLTTKLGGEYLTPKNKAEEKGRELMQDFASMLLPGSRSYGILRNIGIPLAGMALKEGLEKFDVSEGNTQLAKTALMIGLDLASQRQGGARGILNQYRNAARQSTQLAPEFNATQFRTALENLERELLRGGTDATKTPALRKITELLDRIAPNGIMDAAELPAARVSTNRLIEQLGGFDPATPRAIRQGAIANLNRIKTLLTQADTHYGRINPVYGNLQPAYNQAYTAYAQSNVISNFLTKRFGDKVKSKTLKSVLGIGAPIAYGSMHAPIIGALATGTAALGLVGFQAYKYLHRIMRSPVLARHYRDVLVGAMSGNVEKVNRAIKALDKDAQKKQQSILFFEEE